MKNFNKCVIYKPCTDCMVILCKLGLWEVKGPYSIEVYKRAEKKYQQFRDAGKYKNMPKEKTNGNSIKIRRSKAKKF